MQKLKINKSGGVSDQDMNVIPDAPKVDEAALTDANGSNAGETFVKKEEQEERKLFANKKANIGIGIAFGVMVVAIVAAVIFVYLV